MLSLDDPRWRTLRGGYRVPYDPTPALRRLAAEWVNEPAWEELWNELHHQGDLDEASYAALTVIVNLAQRRARRNHRVGAPCAGQPAAPDVAGRRLPSYMEDAHRPRAHGPSDER